MMLDRVLEESSRRLVEAHVEGVAKKRAEQIELLAAAFAKQTGLDPTQCQLVEQRHADGRRTWHFEPKAPPAVGALGIVHPTGNDEVCCHYDETDVRAMGLSVNDVVGDHVVLRNDRPTPNTDGRLVLLHRPMRVFHYPENPENLRAKMWSQQIAIGGTIEMGSNLATLVPDQSIMQLQKHAEEHFSGDVALSQSLPDAAMCDCGEGDGGPAPLPHKTWCRTNAQPNVLFDEAVAVEHSMFTVPSNAQPGASECRCKSLLNGHEAGCPMA